jgi:hypothetical protein
METFHGASMSLAHENPALWSQLIAGSLIARPTYLAYPTLYGKFAYCSAPSRNLMLYIKGS